MIVDISSYIMYMVDCLNNNGYSALTRIMIDHILFINPNL